MTNPNLSNLKTGTIISIEKLINKLPKRKPLIKAIKKMKAIMNQTFTTTYEKDH
jgi:hypothetical protein